MKQKVTAVGFVLLFAVLIVLLTVGKQLQRARAGSKPYCITSHMVIVGAKGDKTEADKFIGQNLNGDLVETYTLPHTRRKVHLNSRGIDVEVGDGTTDSVITTWGTGVPRIAEVAPRDCRDGDQGPVGAGDKDVMLGFEVYRVVHSTPGMFSSEEWRAPTLDCQQLSYKINFFKDSMEANPGSYDGYTVITATSAGNIEPPSSFFTWPADAQEITPDEYYQRVGLNSARDAKAHAMSMAIYNDNKAIRAQSLGMKLLKRWWLARVKPA